ncbi:MAG: hypothetical protein OYG32_06680 [Rhodospirillaceae bacterium]|nr:hypothetical protein [Rhodospirillaceae bacterium]
MKSVLSSGTALKVPTGSGGSLHGVEQFAIFLGALAVEPTSAHAEYVVQQPPRVVLKFGSTKDTALEPQKYISDELIRICEGEVDDLLQTAGVPNWDGDGADPVDAETVSVAKSFVEMLPGGFEPPEISADSHGNIDFDWHLDNGTLFTISIGKEGEVAMAGMRHDKPFSIRAAEQDGDAKLPGILSYGIGWLQKMSTK